MAISETSAQIRQQVSSYVPLAAYSLLTAVSGWRLWVHRARGCTLAALTNAKFAFHGYLFAFAVGRTVASALSLIPSGQGLPVLIFNSFSGCSYISLLLFLEMHWRDILRPLAAVRRTSMVLSWAAFALFNLSLYAFIAAVVYVEWNQNGGQVGGMFWSSDVVDAVLVAVAVSYTSTALRMYVRVTASLKGGAGASAGKDGSTSRRRRRSSVSSNDGHSYLAVTGPGAVKGRGMSSREYNDYYDAVIPASTYSEESRLQVQSSLAAFIGIMLSSACLLCLRTGVSLASSGQATTTWWWQLLVVWLPDVPPCLAYLLLMWPRDDDARLTAASRSKLGILFASLLRGAEGVDGECVVEAPSPLPSPSPSHATPLSPSYLSLSLLTGGGGGLTPRAAGGTPSSLRVPLLSLSEAGPADTSALSPLPRSDSGAVGKGGEGTLRDLCSAGLAALPGMVETSPLPAAAGVSVRAALLTFSCAHLLLPSRSVLERQAGSRPRGDGSGSGAPPPGRSAAPAPPSLPPVHSSVGDRGMGRAGGLGVVGLGRRHNVRTSGALRIGAAAGEGGVGGGVEPSSSSSTPYAGSASFAGAETGPGAEVEEGEVEEVLIPGPRRPLPPLLPGSAGSTASHASSVSRGVGSGFRALPPQPSRGRAASLPCPPPPLMLTAPPAAIAARIGELRTWLSHEVYAVVSVGLRLRTGGGGGGGVCAGSPLPTRVLQGVCAPTSASWAALVTTTLQLEGGEVGLPVGSPPSPPTGAEAGLWRYVGHTEPSFLEEEGGGAGGGEEDEGGQEEGGSEKASSTYLAAILPSSPAGMPVMGVPALSTRAAFGMAVLLPEPLLIEAWGAARALSQAASTRVGEGEGEWEALVRIQVRWYDGEDEDRALRVGAAVGTQEGEEAQDEEGGRHRWSSAEGAGVVLGSSRTARSSSMFGSMGASLSRASLSEVLGGVAGGGGEGLPTDALLRRGLDGSYSSGSVTPSRPPPSSTREQEYVLATWCAPVSSLCGLGRPASITLAQEDGADVTAPLTLTAGLGLGLGASHAHPRPGLLRVVCERVVDVRPGLDLLLPPPGVRFGGGEGRGRATTSGKGPGVTVGGSAGGAQQEGEGEYDDEEDLPGTAQAEGKGVEGVEGSVLKMKRTKSAAAVTNLAAELTHAGAAYLQIGRNERGRGQGGFAPSPSPSPSHPAENGEGGGPTPSSLIRALPPSSRRLDMSTYAYPLALRALLPSLGGAPPASPFSAGAGALPRLPASDAKPGLPLSPSYSVDDGLGGTFTSPSLSLYSAGTGSGTSVGMATPLPFPMAHMGSPVVRAGSPPLPTYVGVVQGIGTLLPRLRSRAGAPLEIRISAVEATIESVACVAIPRAILPLILARRCAQLGAAREALETFIRALQEGQGRGRAGGGLTPTAASAGRAGGGLASVYGRLVGHIEREEDAKAGARWLTHRLLRLQQTVDELCAILSTVCGLEGSGVGQGKDTGLAIIAAQLAVGGVPAGLGARGSGGTPLPFPPSPTPTPELATFRPSTRKKDAGARYLPTNLHVQMLSMQATLSPPWELGEGAASGGWGLPERGPCVLATAQAGSVTAGAPAAHRHGFAGGAGLGKGLVRLLTAAALASPAFSPAARELAVNASLREGEDSRFALRARAEECFSQALAILAAAFCCALQAALDDAVGCTAGEWLGALACDAGQGGGACPPSVARAGVSAWLRLVAEGGEGVRCLRQWTACGWPVLWESLLSAAGKENGMLDDARFAVSACSLVSFAAVDAQEVGAEGGGSYEPAVGGTGVRGGPHPLLSSPAPAPPPAVLSHMVQALPAHIYAAAERAVGVPGGTDGEGGGQGLVLIIPVTGLRAACEAGQVPPGLLLPALAPSVHASHRPYPLIHACPILLSVGINEVAATAALVGGTALESAVNEDGLRALGGYVRSYQAHVNKEADRLARATDSVQALAGVARQSGAGAVGYTPTPLVGEERVPLVGEDGGEGEGRAGRLWAEFSARVDREAGRKVAAQGGRGRHTQASPLSRNERQPLPMTAAGARLLDWMCPSPTHTHPSRTLHPCGPQPMSTETRLPLPIRWLALARLARHSAAVAAGRESLPLPAPPELLAALPHIVQPPTSDAARARMVSGLLSLLRATLLSHAGKDRREQGGGEGGYVSVGVQGGWEEEEEGEGEDIPAHSGKSPAPRTPTRFGLNLSPLRAPTPTPTPYAEAAVGAEATGGGESLQAQALRLADDLALLLRAGRVTCCKSGKDRTGMAVTFEEARRLAQFEAACLAGVAVALSAAPALAAAELDAADASSSSPSPPPPSSFLAHWLLCAPLADLDDRWAASLDRIRGVLPLGQGAAAAVPELAGATAGFPARLPHMVLGARAVLLAAAAACAEGRREGGNDLALVASLGGGRGGGQSLAVAVQSADDAVCADVVGTANFLREYGSRISNAEKNTGKMRYAFSALQRAFFPLEYRAPASTIGGTLT